MKATNALPAGSAGAIPPTLRAQHRARASTLRKLARLRREARDEIRRLIDFLDSSDAYASTELEDDDESEPDVDREPLLGSFDRILNQDHAWTMRASDPCGDREHDRADIEPSLGALESHPIRTIHMRPGDQVRDRSGDQSWWGLAGRDDREDDSDFEPSLGSTNCLGYTDETQVNWARGGSDEREQDDSDSGIGDRDGLLEQIGERGWIAGTMG